MGEPTRGHLHTALLEALQEELTLQHTDAFVEDTDTMLVIPSGVTPRTAYVKIDVSALAEVALALLDRRVPTLSAEGSGDE